MELLRVGDAALHFRILVESGFLMRVFAVAEILHLHVSMAVHVRQAVFIVVHLFGQIVSDSAVVEAGVEEGFAGKFQTEIIGELVVLNAFQDVAVLRRVHHDGYVFIILGSRAHHGRAADVDIFNGFFAGHIRLRDGFTEGIEVHSHQVDAGDAVFFHGFHVFRIVTDGEDAAVNFRMQGLYAAVHHFRETGHFGNGLHRNAGVGDGFHGAAGGNNFHAQLMKSLCKFYNPCLIRYADQGSFYCHFDSPLLYFFPCMPATWCPSRWSSSAQYAATVRT